MCTCLCLIMFVSLGLCLTRYANIMVLIRSTINVTETRKYKTVVYINGNYDKKFIGGVVLVRHRILRDTCSSLTLYLYVPRHDNRAQTWGNSDSNLSRRVLHGKIKGSCHGFHHGMVSWRVFNSDQLHPNRGLC